MSLYKLIFISTLLTLLACKKETNTQLAQTNVADTVQSISFQTVNSEGILFKGEAEIYDEFENNIYRINIAKAEKVKIVGISAQQYNLKGNNDICEKANFVKIIRNNKELILFGKRIYLVDKANIYPFTSANNNYNVLAVENFQMDAGNEEGLTGCEDYKYLILENISKKSFSKIPFKANKSDIYRTSSYYAILYNDDMSGDSIYKSHIEQDTLALAVKSFYQEGGAAYLLKIVISNNDFYSFIDSYKSYEEEQLEELERLK